MSQALTRILLVARHTAGEAARQRYLPVTALLATAVAGLSLILRALNFGDSELKFIADIGFGALFLFGSTLAVVLTTHLFFAEIDNRTALTVLAKPLRRWEFLTGKLLGVWSLLALLALGVLAVTGAILASRHAEMAAQAAQDGRPLPVFEFGGYLLFSLLQTLRLGLVAACTLFVCSYSRTALFAYGASFGVLFGGQTLWLAREWADSQTGATARLLKIPLNLVPDLQAFNLGEALVFPHKGAPTSEALMTIPYALIWMALLTAVGARLFRDREI